MYISTINKPRSV